MITIPVAHNGQSFNLVQHQNLSTSFDLVLHREVFVFVGGDWVYETVREHLGQINISVAEVNVRIDEMVSAFTQYNYERKVFPSLNDAVAFLVDEGRPCRHAVSTGVDMTFEGDTIYRCDDCSATYIFGEDDEDEVVVVAYAHPHA